MDEDHKALTVTAIVVRVGKANADTDKAERHDGNGDQTFHPLCSIDLCCLRQAFWHARLARETKGTTRTSVLTDVLVSHAKTRSEGVEARGGGRTETTVPSALAPGAVAAAVVSKCEQQRGPGPYSISGCRCRMDTCEQHCSRGSHRPMRPSTFRSLRHQSWLTPLP